MEALRQLQTWDDVKRLRKTPAKSEEVA